MLILTEKLRNFCGFGIDLIYWFLFDIIFLNDAILRKR